MRVRTLVLFVVLCMFFFVGFVQSLSMEPSYETKIIVDELQQPIHFSLFISDAPSGEYNVYTLADMMLEPSDIFRISSGNITKNFTFVPNENFDETKRYSFTYILHHRGVEQLEEQVTVEVKSLAEVLEVGSDSIDPESDEVRFYVKNKADVPISLVPARFSSVLFDIEEIVSLKPLEKKYIPVIVDPAKLKRTKAGVYIIDAIFQTSKGNVQVSGNLYLGEKKGITTTQDSGGFLIATKTINKVNAGNVLETVEITIEKNIISRLFTSFNVEPHFVDRRGVVVEYTWLKNRLGPGEAFTVKARTNYLLPLIIIILFFVVFSFVRRLLQKKLEVSKSVQPVKTKNGEFALRVKISLKALKAVENVSLIDKVPKIVKIYKKFNDPKPDKIDLESRRLHWNLGDLEAGEERVFSYIVYSRVGYVGKFSLPAALAVFEKDTELHEVESNHVFFMSDQVRE